MHIIMSHVETGVLSSIILNVVIPRYFEAMSIALLTTAFCEIKFNICLTSVVALAAVFFISKSIMSIHCYVVGCACSSFPSVWHMMPQKNILVIVKGFHQKLWFMYILYINAGTISWHHYLSFIDARIGNKMCSQCAQLIVYCLGDMIAMLSLAFRVNLVDSIWIAVGLEENNGGTSTNTPLC